MEYSAVNTIWVLLGAALVFFMQAGFSMCEAGFTRAKNTGNILMKNWERELSEISGLTLTNLQETVLWA